MFALSECFVVFRVGGFVFPSGSQMFSEFGKPVWKEDIPIYKCLLLLCNFTDQFDELLFNPDICHYSYSTPRWCL